MNPAITAHSCSLPTSVSKPTNEALTLLQHPQSSHPVIFFTAVHALRYKENGNKLEITSYNTRNVQKSNSKTTESFYTLLYSLRFYYLSWKIQDRVGWYIKATPFTFQGAACIYTWKNSLSGSPCANHKNYIYVALKFTTQIPLRIN